jgi:dihydrofolate reductase
MKITLRPSVTIDGFIADLNGECYSWINPADEERYDSAIKQSGCELVGRKTYEQYKDDFDQRQGIVTYVYTNQSKFEDTLNVKFVGVSAQDAVSQIEKDGFTDLIISGGGELNGLLAEAKLIDEAHLSIHPVYLYKGISLFGSYNPKFSLELLTSNTSVPGVLQSIYKLNY